jgi:hypothetical protein
VELICVRKRFCLFAQTAVKHAAMAYDIAELQDTKLSSFAHDEYFSCLSNQRLGHTLLTAFNLASTQVLLKECAPGEESLRPPVQPAQRLVCASVRASRHASTHRSLSLSANLPDFALHGDCLRRTQELRRFPRGHGVGGG